MRHINLYEPRHEKTGFLHMGNKDADQLCGNHEVAHRLCCRYTDSTIPLLSNTKFQASSHLLWLYSLVRVGPGRKPECWFSHDAAQKWVFCSKKMMEGK